MVRGSGTSPPHWGLACIPEMEPKMTNLKVLSMAAALALVVPLALPTASFAQFKGGGGGGARGGAVSVGGGGGGFRGGAMAGGGGNFRAAPAMGGGAAYAGSKFGGSPGYVGGGAVRGPAYAGGGNWNGGNWNGGWRRHRGGFWPGVAAGVVVGGALANSYAYYGDPYYYGNNYYDDGYYDDSTVAVVPG